MQSTPSKPLVTCNGSVVQKYTTGQKFWVGVMHVFMKIWFTIRFIFVEFDLTKPIKKLLNLIFDIFVLVITFLVYGFVNTYFPFKQGYNYFKSKEKELKSWNPFQSIFCLLTSLLWFEVPFIVFIILPKFSIFQRVQLHNFIDHSFQFIMISLIVLRAFPAIIFSDKICELHVGNTYNCECNTYFTYPIYGWLSIFGFVLDDIFINICNQGEQLLIEKDLKQKDNFS